MGRTSGVEGSNWKGLSAEVLCSEGMCDMILPVRRYAIREMLLSEECVTMVYTDDVRDVTSGLLVLSPGVVVVIL